MRWGAPVVGEHQFRRVGAAGAGVLPTGDAGGEILLQTPDRRMILGQLHRRENTANPGHGKQPIVAPVGKVPSEQQIAYESACQKRRQRLIPHPACACAQCGVVITMYLP